VPAGFAHGVGGLQELTAVFDRARAGDDHHAALADTHAVERKG
jgi:hypothetical protein